MPKRIADVEQKIIEHRDLQIQKTFRSIQQHGIVPMDALEKVEKDCQPTFIFGSAETQKNVCVNYLDLKNSSIGECKRAIKFAVWEEYTGIFGISLERIWSLDVQKDPKLVASEIIERLRNNIVLVLKPPTNVSKVSQPIKKGDSSKPVTTTNLCYQLRNLRGMMVSADGISQIGGECLTLEQLSTEQVMEIKTDHKFNKEEILAVLIPENLIHLLPVGFNEHFSGKINSVPMTSKLMPINKIPEILKIIHGETIPSGMMEVRVPDYEGVLCNKILPQYKQFSLHAVRLQTRFDFMARFVANLNDSASILKDALACNLVEYPDHSGWVLVHKSKITDLKKRFSEADIVRLKLNGTHLLESDRVSRILETKKQFRMNRCCDVLSSVEQKGLCSLEGVTAINTGSATMISCSRGQEAIVKSVANLKQLGLAQLKKEQEEAKREAATIKLQSYMRMFFTKRGFLYYKDLKKLHEDAQQKYEAAKKELESSEQKLLLAGQRLKLGMCPP